MNQQLIFNNDVVFDATRHAISFSCLVSGLKVHCYIPLPAEQQAEAFLQQIKADAFHWEDAAEQAIADDAYNSAGEIWL